MKKFALLILGWLVFSSQSPGQSNIDSLKTVISRAQDDSTKVDQLLQLSKGLLDVSPLDAILYANQAHDLAEKLNYRKGAGYALKNKGLGYQRQGKYLEALENWQESLKVFESINFQQGQANILQNLGTIYFDQADDEKALEYFLKALKVAEQIADTLRIAENLANIGAIYGKKKATYDNAIEYDLKALAFNERLGNADAVGTISVNVGEIYFDKGDDTTALKFYQKSLKAYEGSANTPYALNHIGLVYKKRKDYDRAIQIHDQAYKMAEKLDAKLDLAQSLLYLGDVYREKKEFNRAIETYEHALTAAKQINANVELKDIYRGLSQVYYGVSDYGNAFRYQTMMIDIKDTLYNIETDRKLGTLVFNFEIQKKEGEINLLTKDKTVKDLQIKRQKFAKNSFMVGLLLVFLIALLIFRNYRIKVKTHRIVDQQKNQIEQLLLNILPQDVAHELQVKGHSTPRHYENVSVMFTDFKGFTIIADNMSPQELVRELNACFMAFDAIMEKYNLEKIKTIGDSYMCAGNIPRQDPEHQYNMVRASLEIQQYIKENNQRRAELGLASWDVRVGIHIGPLVAGVVGKKKYAYDIWGSTVNIASRMESNGMPGKVNISAAVYDMIKDRYACSYRGKIEAKNIGEIDMYFVDHELEAVEDFHSTLLLEQNSN